MYRKNLKVERTRLHAVTSNHLKSFVHAVLHAVLHAVARGCRKSLKTQAHAVARGCTRCAPIPPMRFAAPSGYAADASERPMSVEPMAEKQLLICLARVPTGAGRPSCGELSDVPAAIPGLGQRQEHAGIAPEAAVAALAAPDIATLFRALVRKRWAWLPVGKHELPCLCNHGGRLPIFHHLRVPTGQWDRAEIVYFCNLFF